MSVRSAPLVNQTLRNPVEELLLSCVSPIPNSERIVQLAKQELDWNYLFQLARRHALVQLLFQRLNQTAAELVPNDIFENLRTAYQQNTARNLILANELGELIDALEKDGIEAIPYKGPVLAIVAYGDPTLRRYVDLDLMVRRHDVLKASEVIRARGYQAARELTEEQQAILLRTQHNLPFMRDAGRLLVELHWQVSSHLFAASVSAEELWQKLQPVILNGRSLKTLATDDLLFSLCVHGSRHLWERLAWICDVAFLLSRRPDIRWPQLLDRASAAGAERMFLLGLHLAQKLLAVSLPEAVKLRIARDPQLHELADQIIARLFKGTVHKPATAAEIFRYNLQVRDSWAARARYVAFMFEPTDGDLGALNLPRSLRFAYYVLRPFRVLRWGPGR